MVTSNYITTLVSLLENPPWELLENDYKVQGHLLKMEPTSILLLTHRLKEFTTLFESRVKITCLNSTFYIHSMPINKHEALPFSTFKIDCNHKLWATINILDSSLKQILIPPVLWCSKKDKSIMHIKRYSSIQCWW